MAVRADRAPRECRISKAIKTIVESDKFLIVRQFRSIIIIIGVDVDELDGGLNDEFMSSSKSAHQLRYETSVKI